MALQALMKFLGFGKTKDEPKKAAPRYHPYDEISDDQLTGARPAPRVHPYDEVSDAVLEENRSKAAAAKAPVRRHDYDEVDLDRTMSKVKKVAVNGEGLNYVEVELPKGGAGSGSGQAVKRSEPATIYSEVRTAPAASSQR